MRIGVDTSKLPVTDPHAQLDLAAELGFTGVLFRSVVDLSPTLEPAVLQEVRDHADALGLHVEIGIAKVNPYMTAELPEIRALGGGDYMLALERMVAACASIGVHELWTATAAWKRQYPGRFQYDRFRTDVTWTEQLDGTRRVLERLRPCLLDHGSHLDVETHEEITTWEVVRLVEAVGPEVLGITFDVANVVVRGEEPVAALRRCLPHLRMTQLRDVALWPSPLGLERYVVPVGEGVLPWPSLLSLLQDSGVGMLTVEGIESGGLRSRKAVDLDDPDWVDGHPDLVPGEVAALRELSTGYRSRAAAGLAAGIDELAGAGDQLDFLRRCRAALEPAVVG